MIVTAKTYDLNACLPPARPVIYLTFPGVAIQTTGHVPYKNLFHSAVRFSGLDLGVANALRSLRAGASVKGGGWKRLLDRAVRNNMERRAAQQQRDETGRAA